MSTELITSEPETISGQEVSISLTTESGFSLAERAARLLASSTLVPPMYQGEANLGNCVIALHMAARLKADPLTIMQNLFPIQGRPVWSASFVIGLLNNCGLFSRLKYRLTGTRGDDSFGCIASAVELSSGESLEGTEITVGMAKAEGWWQKKGSKWPTMTEQMLKYRAATFFARTFVPELLVGLHTADEVEDFTSLDVNVPTKQSEPAKPTLSPMELLKQQQAAATVSQVVTTTPTPTHEPGFCTLDQKAHIESLFGQAGIDVDAQRGILERRGVGTIRSLTEEQATGLIAILQAKIQQAIEQTQPEPEPEPVAVPHAALDLNGPCTPAHVEAVREAMQDLEKELPGSAEAFIVNLADRDLVVEDFTVAECEALIEAIKYKQMQAFFDNLPSLKVAQ